MATQRVGRLTPVVLGVLAITAACAKQETAPPAAIDHRALDESAIRAIDSAWVRGAAAKSLDGLTAAYADSAVVLAPGEPMAQGRDAIRKAFQGMLGAPGFGLTFGPDKITVSGDVAYEIGSYALTMNDKKGKPQTSKAKYAVVWAKQADGMWKAVVDAITTTQ